MEEGELREAMRAEISKLPEREQAILILYYEDGLTLSEIGDALGVTESRVSQIHTKAVLQLRSRLAAAGMGSDTCGSIRIPAAFNNLVGLRPTKGLSSIDGIVPLSVTQDTGGTLVRTVADLAAEPVVAPTTLAPTTTTATTTPPAPLATPTKKKQ